MVAAVVLIQAERDHIPRAARETAALEGVAEVYSVAGDWDLIAILRVPEWEQIATKVFEYGEQAIRGRLTVDATLAALDRDVNGLLEKRRWMLARRALP